jgi:hypothetical protein
VIRNRSHFKKLEHFLDHKNLQLLWKMLKRVPCLSDDGDERKREVAASTFVALGSIPIKSKNTNCRSGLT